MGQAANLAETDSGIRSKPDASALAFSHIDKIAWAKKMIADEGARRELCDREFALADHEKRGTLNLEEVVATVHRICDHMAIDLPTKDKIVELVSKVHSAEGGPTTPRGSPA